MNPNDAQPISELLAKREPIPFYSVRPGSAKPVRPGSQLAADSSKSDSPAQTSSENSRPGRKPLLDDIKRREICAILALGGTRLMAATYVGCSRDTITRTALRDPVFAEQLCKAEVGCEIQLLKNLQNAVQGGKHARAVTWALERFYPERYVRRPPRTLTHAQLKALLRDLGRNMVAEIPTAADRQLILGRLKRMMGDARRRVGRKRRTPKRKKGW